MKYFLFVVILLLLFTGGTYSAPVDTTFGIEGNWWVKDTLFAGAVIGDTIIGAIAEVDSEFAILWFKYESPSDPDSGKYRIFRTNNAAWQAANPTIKNFLVITSNNTGLAVLDTLYVGRGIISGRADLDSMLVRLVMGKGTGASCPDKYVYFQSNSIIAGPDDSGRVYVNVGDLANMGNYPNSVFVIDDDIGGSVRSTSKLLNLYHDLNGAAGDTVTGDMYALYVKSGYSSIDGHAQRAVGGYFKAGRNVGVRDKNIGVWAEATGADTNYAGYFVGNIVVEDTLFVGSSRAGYLTKSTTDSSLHYNDGTNDIKLNRKTRALTLDPYECAIFDSTYNSVSYKVDISQHVFMSGDSIVPCLKIETDSTNLQYYNIFVKWRIPEDFHEGDSLTVKFKRDGSNSAFYGRVFNIDGDSYDRTDSTAWASPMANAGGADPGSWETENFGLDLSFSAGDYAVLQIYCAIKSADDLYLGDVEIYYREK